MCIPCTAGPIRPVWPQGMPTPTGKFEVPGELDWNLWLGPAKMIDYNPAYLPFNWRGWWAFGTGALGDMACHIMDPIYRILTDSIILICGMQCGHCLERNVE